MTSAATHDDTDETMAAVHRAVELGASGHRAEARDALDALWTRVGPDGDALHRCTIAHYLADLQEDVAAELAWDRRALAAVTDLTDERARRFHTSWQVRGLLPSLHLNLADGYRRLGEVGSAREHLDLARETVDDLPDDGYGTMIRAGIGNLAEALDTGSRAPLGASDPLDAPA
ncbi:hypothetical protein AWW66_11940 [Micromonospora rosaria]|uniref:Tetratricopeptide repeat protein n=1 Tax=Micromonospora rosaria TaxID=47874 RepID=A0A136PTH1_9ACTN|nr:hypothetical protein [Micromonospora rosaria]KXK61712.1 hypothetical protein AWW66_11940 [Micromonospora rosaria]